MRIWTTLLLALVLCSCRHARVSRVEVGLAGPVNPQYLIYIQTISSDKVIDDERKLIEEMYAPLLQKALSKRGYRTQLVTSGAPQGLYLTLRGEVTHYRPGSRKARTWPRDSAGAQRLYTKFYLENYYNETTVMQFVVVSNAGRSSNFSSIRSYLQSRLQEAAIYAAAHIAGRPRSARVQ
jgi:hypothetical protein